MPLVLVLDSPCNAYNIDTMEPELIAPGTHDVEEVADPDLLPNIVLRGTRTGLPARYLQHPESPLAGALRVIDSEPIPA